ncbi:hypothetical protein LJC27_01030 [Christensenellaceae bacterium OttesenSCG-928-M15]|nr:hypothetical protein [Christensenellaceae bacterium OttesenSCG-928-M15]
MAIVLQKNDLQAGARVILDINGTAYSSHIQEVQNNNFLYVDVPKYPGTPPRMFYNQPVYLMQELTDGGLVCVLLRFLQHGVKDGRKDIFRIVRSTFHVTLGSGLRLPVCSWCDLTVFSIFNRLHLDYAGRVQMTDLCETGLSLIVPEELPYDTFAECEFLLNDRRFKLPSRATYGISSENGAYHTMDFDFVCITKREQTYIRQYLFKEQARRLREA